MTDATPLLIPAGTVFTPDDLIFYSDRDSRSLDEAIAEADVLVSCPHSGAAVPAELSRFLAPEFTRRLQFDFSDQSTSPIVRRWAQIDPRIVYVENPHPRMIRDPNREKPANLRATLGEAFARVEAAGPGVRTDLSGVDAVRPVTFSFYPLLKIPRTEAELNDLADTFTEVATHGLGVYESTRDDLIERFVSAKLTAAARPGSGAGAGAGSGSAGGSFTTLSFHDTMNHTTTPDGAVNVDRPEADRLPRVVALSNRGDTDGDPRVDATGELQPVTMQPDRIRSLAEAHRSGFQVELADDVALNKPYLGSYEIIKAGARFRELAPAAESVGLILAAVQAEFLREFLLGAANTATLMQPGTGWVTPDPEHVDRIAHACKASWDLFRDGDA